MDKRVVLGMSGGLDSSVAAHLLQQQGYDVTGITLRLSEVSRCCSEHDVCDARAVAQKLKIEHYTIDASHLFKPKVIDYFIAEYRQGRTPNPCAVCNREVKFRILLDTAREHGISLVATGHYACISAKGTASTLQRAVETRKDQSYFLGRLKRQWLGDIRFPIGQYSKREVREIGRISTLPFRNKEESQEICFIEGNDYRMFLADKLPALQKHGDIIDTSGKVLGTHKGIFFYTIGQRKGIQVNSNHALYVMSIDTRQNTITVGEERDIFQNSFRADSLNWLVDRDEVPNACMVQIRSQHRAAKAYLRFENTSASVEFEAPQMAITPGQLAVFYDNNTVLGSGWIAEVI